MPFANNGEARIFWRENGHGEPLLLIMGIGYIVKSTIGDRWKGGTFGL